MAKAGKKGQDMEIEGADQWFVVRTNIRCERRASRSLRAAGYRVYWPQMRKSSIHHRTKKRIFKRIGLLTGYVFVRMTRLSSDGRPDWYALRACDGVECVLGVNGRPFAIPRDDVVRFMQWQRQRKFDDVYLEKLAKKVRRKALIGKYPRGTRVRVVEGPFGGFSARISKVNAKGTLAAMVEIFGRLTPVEFEPEQVEVIDIKAEAA